MTNGMMPPTQLPLQDPWRVARRCFNSVGAGLVVMLAVWLLSNMLLSEILVALWPVPASTGYPVWVSWLVSNGPLYLFAMPLAVLVFRRGAPALTTNRFALPVADLFTLLLGCLPVMYAGNIIGVFLSGLVSGGQATNRVADVAQSGGLITNLVFFVILAPLCEEWLFRKQIIDRTRIYGEKASILLSALAFALFHMNLYQFFYAFGLGLILGYVYMRTSRIGYSVGFHMLINFNGAVLAPWILSLLPDAFWQGVDAVGASQNPVGAEAALLASVDPTALTVIVVYSLAILALTIAGLVLLIVRRRSFHFYETPLQLPRGGQGRAIYSTPGVVIYVLLSLFLTFVLTVLG